jgi:hypothetical protein
MALALALLALLALAVTTDDQGVAAAATAMAHHLDTVLLAPLANASASTGLMLSLGTAWGLTQHRWVLAKFAITLVQLYAGIFLLSGALGAAAEGRSAPLALVVGTAAMAGAIGFQAWLSVAKPGSRTRWSRDRRSGRHRRRHRRRVSDARAVDPGPAGRRRGAQADAARLPPARGGAGARLIRWAAALPQVAAGVHVCRDREAGYQP